MSAPRSCICGSGDWQMGRNQQPQTAIVHFRDAQRLTGTKDKLHGLAAYDAAVALYYLGAYRSSADAFHALLIDKQHLCGYDFLHCNLFYRHTLACANYHSERAAKGIPELPLPRPPVRRGGACDLPARLRKALWQRRTLLAHCRVNGRGQQPARPPQRGSQLGRRRRGR